MHARVLALAAACAIAAGSFGAATVTLPAHAKQGDLWKSIQAQDQMLFQVNAPELWFTQQIDHFAAAPRAGNTTYQQRYYEDNTFWKQPNGAVILYIGGEGALTNAPAGFVQVLAQRYGAKILALEHRFYGKSIPNGNLETDNYKYLTVQQALADLKHFKESYQKNNMPAHSDNKWIAVGGSYPGALSTWFRIAYPDTTVVSLASSGVVDPVYEFYQFDEQVALSAGEKCASVLRKTTASFEDQIANGNATKVKGLLGAQDLCDADFFYMIADSAAMAVQYGHKNVLCDHMIGALESKQSLTEQFANFTIQMYGKAFGSGCFYDTNCLANDRSRWADVRSWRWQKCAQLAYFQIAPKSGSLRASIVNLEYHEKQCQAVFGDVVDPRKGVEAITKLYGGKNPHGHKIFFSNGGDDPWQRASVLTSIADDEPANLAVCDLCGHCGDLRTPGPDTPAPLQKQREEILAYFDKWLDAGGAAAALAQQQESDASVVVGRKTATTPLVLVPIVFAFLALLVILHVDLVRDSPLSSGYERLTGVRRFSNLDGSECSILLSGVLRPDRHGRAVHLLVGDVRVRDTAHGDHEDAKHLLSRDHVVVDHDRERDHEDLLHVAADAKRHGRRDLVRVEARDVEQEAHDACDEVPRRERRQLVPVLHQDRPLARHEHRQEAPHRRQRRLVQDQVHRVQLEVAAEELVREHDLQARKDDRSKRDEQPEKRARLVPLARQVDATRDGDQTQLALSRVRLAQDQHAQAHDDTRHERAHHLVERDGHEPETPVARDDVAHKDERKVHHERLLPGLQRLALDAAVRVDVQQRADRVAHHVHERELRECKQRDKEREKERALGPQSNAQHAMMDAAAAATYRDGEADRVERFLVPEGDADVLHEPHAEPEHDGLRRDVAGLRRAVLLARVLGLGRLAFLQQAARVCRVVGRRLVATALLLLHLDLHRRAGLSHRRRRLWPVGKVAE